MHNLPHAHQSSPQPGRGTGNRWHHSKPSDLFWPPPPSPNHPILLFSTAFKNAIKENRIYALKALSKQFIYQLETNLDFLAYESVQEIAEDLSPKIKTLQANLNIMETFHNKEDLHSFAIT